MKIALLSRWHVHADDYARDVQEHGDLTINYVWDEDPVRGQAWADELGVSFESKLENVLANPEIDAVVVTTPTSMHKKVIIQAAKHGKHIFTEKVLSLNTSDNEAIYAAVEEHDVKLMVSLPLLTKPDYLAAQKAIDEGWIGELTMVRCRFAHSGGVAPKGEDYGWLPERFYNKDQAGGGAMMDLGAHPIYLTNRLAGKAKRVSASLMKDGNHDVDTNAALLVEYESGALGVIETSFLSHGSPFQLEVYGTQGTLLISDDKKVINSVLVNDGVATELTEAFGELPMPLIQWVNEIKENTKPSITRADVVNLTKMNEAALKSVKEARKVNLSELSD